MTENSFSNTLYMLLLALCVLFTHAAKADEVSIDNEQEHYHRSCQPGSYAEDGLSPRDLDDLRHWRAHYLAFLANPEPTIAQLMDSALVKSEKSKDLSLADQLRLVFLWAGSCEPTLHYAPWLKEAGCKDTKGAVHSGAKALELCQDVAEAMQRVQRVQRVQRLAR